MLLRDYQSEAVTAIFDYFGSEIGSPLVVAPTGAGKSLIIAAFCQQACQMFPETRVLVLSHVKELIQQDHQQLLRHWPEAHASIYSAGLGRKNLSGQVVFAGIQSFARVARQAGFFDLVVVDECFPAGTEVLTPSGAKPIEKIQPGDVVLNATGSGVVEACRMSSSSKIVKVELSNGTTVECTENHPFFTEKGWVQAGELAGGTRLFSGEDVRALRSGVPPVLGFGRSADAGTSLDKAEVLLDLLLEEAGEPHVGSGRSPEDDKNTERNRTCAGGSLGERTRPDGTAGSTLERLGRGLGARACSGDRIKADRRLPDSFQDRHRKSCGNDRDRGGRVFTLRETADRGPEKRRVPEPIRVVSVSHKEYGSHQVVYNLQVSGHPSFFAGGVLVHNCHLIPRKSGTLYRQTLDALAAANPAVKMVGFTATPYRLDSGMLHEGRDAVFDAICYDIPVAMLVERGYLAPLVSKRPSQTFDLSGLHTRAGEYIDAELSARFDRDDLNRAILAEATALGADRQAWLVFCIDVAHAGHMATILREMGKRAEVISGKTPAADRARIIDAYKRGDLDALASVNVLSIGFDAPRTDLIVMARPTQSTGLYIQQAGRGMRVKPQGGDCLVLDFASNVMRHGPVDAINAIRPKKGEPEAEAGEAPAKACPDCQSIVHAAVRECPDCGYLFPPPEVKIARTAGTAAIMRLTAPEPTWANVQDVAYDRHRGKDGKPDSLRVEYLIGGEVAREWVCFEHSGYARQKAVAWWQERAGTTPPSTVAEALERIYEVRKPVAAVPQRNGQYLNIGRVKLAASDPWDPFKDDPVEASA